MQVSIVIPAYNAAAYLSDTLESAIRQTFTDWELIVVDDGSRDNTPEIVRGFMERDSRVRLVQQANGGLAAARNAGYRASDPRSPYLIFLDADDTWEVDALERLVTAIERQPDSPAAYGLARYMDGAGAPIRPGELEAWSRDRMRAEEGKLTPCAPGELTTFSVLAVRNCIATSGVILLRRSALERAGLFDSTPRGCEDYHMWLRLSRLGPLAWIDAVVLSYRRHESSMSQRGRMMDRGDMLARRQLLLSPDLSPEERRLLALGYRGNQRNESHVWLKVAGHSFARRRLITAARELRRAIRDYYRSVRGLPAEERVNG